MSQRISIPEYAMLIAEVASLRSEDPFVKVGAAALDYNNRIIATGYNGLISGMNVDNVFWEDREARRKYVIHAEVNLCSLFKRGDAQIVAVTLKPCISCYKMLCAYDIKQIYYRDEYTDDVDELVKFYGVELIKMSETNKELV